MRTVSYLMTLSLMMLLAGGCVTEKFTGEWLEKGQLTPQGEVVPPARERLMALQFGPVSTMRLGAYYPRTGVVDAETVQSNSYFLFDGWSKAQFGAMIGRVEGDKMIVTINGVDDRLFVRHRGKSMFPPLVKLPQFSVVSPAHKPPLRSSDWQQPVIYAMSGLVYP